MAVDAGPRVSCTGAWAAGLFDSKVKRLSVSTRRTRSRNVDVSSSAYRFTATANSFLMSFASSMASTESRPRSARLASRLGADDTSKRFCTSLASCCDTSSLSGGAEDEVTLLGRDDGLPTAERLDWVTRSISLVVE